MSGVGSWAVQERRKTTARASSWEAASLMTPVGVVEGDILTYLEQHDAVTLDQLIQQLAWPSLVIVMAVGALIREGLIRASQFGKDFLVRPSPSNGTDTSTLTPITRRR